MGTASDNLNTLSQKGIEQSMGGGDRRIKEVEMAFRGLRANSRRQNSISYT